MSLHRQIMGTMLIWSTVEPLRITYKCFCLKIPEAQFVFFFFFTNYIVFLIYGLTTYATPCMLHNTVAHFVIEMNQPNVFLLLEQRKQKLRVDPFITAARASDFKKASFSPPPYSLSTVAVFCLSEGTLSL